MLFMMNCLLVYWRILTDSITIRTLEGWIIEANPAACELLGYSYDELLTKNFMDLIHRIVMILYLILGRLSYGRVWWIMKLFLLEGMGYGLKRRFVV